MEALIKKINPTGKIIRTTHSKIPLTEIINTGLFNFQDAMLNPGWLQEIRGTHIPESEEYGITSFVYRRAKPFHPQRLHELLLSGGIETVVRSKGTAWVADVMEFSVEWAGTSSLINLEIGGPWIALLEESVRSRDIQQSLFIIR